MSDLDSHLFGAVESNDITAVRSIIQNQMTNINKLNACGKTSLHIAVEKGFLELAKELLDADSDINAKTLNGKTPFFIAAEGGKFALVELLLEQPNLNVNMFHHGETPLHIVCEKGHTDVVKVLLADDRCTPYLNLDYNGSKPIHIASKYGRTEILTNLLEKKADVNSADSNDRTPLWVALESNQEESALVLLEDPRVNVNLRYLNKTPLEYAIRERNIIISKLLIDRGADIETLDEDGLNPLHCAVDEGMLDVVDYLLKKGANVHSKTKKGNTSLHIAAMNGKVEIAKLLIDNGADIHARSENYYSALPLQLAVKCSKLEVATFLISEGSDINVYDPHAHFAMNRGGNLLHWASRRTDEKMIRFLVENGADVNATENDGRTPLCLLVKHGGSFDIMRYLIEKGASLNNQRGGTPLYWAFYTDYGGSNPEVANFLIEMATDVNGCIDYHGYDYDQLRTALHLARHLSTVKILIDKGADVNAGDKSKNSPLHSARSPSIAKCLLEHGAEVNATNDSGDIPLHHVLNFHIAKVLIEKGANVNAINNKGYTPLHVARNTPIAKLLIEKGAELNAVTTDGKTVLHTAAEADVFSDARFRGVPDAVKFFLQKGIDVNVVDNHQNTPLHSCALSNNIQVAAILLEEGANINAVNELNKTPIECDQFFDTGGGVFCRMLRSINKIFTAINDNEKIDSVRRLLAEVKTANLIQDDTKLTPLHCAVIKNQKKMVQYLLQEKITPRNIDRITSGRLYRGKGTLVHQDPYIANILDKIRVNPKCKNNWTPLHYAAKDSDLSITALLLQSGAAYDAKTNEGHMPSDLTNCKSTKELLEMVDQLFKAVKDGNQGEVVRLLTKDSVIINAVNSDGCSPLYFAISNGHEDITAFLLEHDANVTQVTNEGCTILNLATAKGDGELINTIFKHANKIGRLNCLVNENGKNGSTALHIAVENSSVEITQALLRHGAMYNAENEEKIKPSDLSKSEDITNVLKLVEEFFELAENDSPEILNRLERMEPDDFLAVTNARDRYGLTFTDVIENNAKLSYAQSHKLSELKKLKEKALLIRNNPCHYSQNPSYSEEELEDLDLGFGLFD